MAIEATIRKMYKINRVEKEEVFPNEYIITEKDKDLIEFEIVIEMNIQDKNVSIYKEWV